MNIKKRQNWVLFRGLRREEEFTKCHKNQISNQKIECIIDTMFRISGLILNYSYTNKSEMVTHFGNLMTTWRREDGQGGMGNRDMLITKG